MGPTKQQTIDEKRMFELNVYPGYRLKLQFGFNAGHHNTVIVYNQELTEVLRRDNRNVGNSDWISEKNTGQNPIRLFVTGWNLDPRDNQWKQSPYRELTRSYDMAFVQVGFEDWSDNDYDDAAVLAQTII
ncbi:hypothetical protein [Paenibacillus sanguinis]|uniref:hypothetical protein n=1 Tax=Paenibacillus sanguinis TaxID=225906 RepID=UPI00146A3EE1|nr:hypothetical protein [Paenibacillus sanguinis]